MVLGQIVAMVLAILVGLSLGALGSGGSIITIPLLVYVAGVPAENAVGMSLVIVGATSLVGALSSSAQRKRCPEAESSVSRLPVWWVPTSDRTGPIWFPEEA